MGDRFRDNLEALKATGLALNPRVRRIAGRSGMTVAYIRDRAREVLARSGLGSLVVALEQDAIPRTQPKAQREAIEDHRRLRRFQRWADSLGLLERNDILHEATRGLALDLRTDPVQIRTAVFRWWSWHGEPEPESECHTADIQTRATA